MTDCFDPCHPQSVEPVPALHPTPVPPTGAGSCVTGLSFDAVSSVLTLTQDAPCENTVAVDLSGLASAASVGVGTVDTGAPGSAASVTNSGSTSNVVLDFVIPRGDSGVSPEVVIFSTDAEALAYSVSNPTAIVFSSEGT